ncbi:MAG: hypothetical protein M1813_009138 [Trichoglossum hirsutum]|nr:MAG: hypothetical protein M1813_009138 [Trichoglossum hirsutum]
MFPSLLSTLDSAFLLFSLSASLVSGAPTKQALSRRAFTHYQAFGDSYSAAPGAGKAIRGGEACARFDGDYPYQLYAMLNDGARIPDQDVLSCTGATAQVIEKHSELMDPNADLTTISLGGNNVSFGDVVNSCVYRFGGPIGATECNIALNTSSRGYEFAMKLSQGKELYLFVTHSGDNCYKATEKMINTCMTDKNDGNPIHDATWINGPNYGEFYQAGVRPLNDPKGTHDPMTTVPSDHLGYTHIECRRTDGFLHEAYSINLSGWDDGQYGQTILNKVKECGLSSTAWKYEPGTDALFADGTRNDHWAAFNMVVSNGRCAESKIEEAMGLCGGVLDCPINARDYFELDLMA